MIHFEMHMAAMADQVSYNSDDDDSDSFESAQPTDEERVPIKAYIAKCYDKSHTTAIASLAKVTEAVDTYDKPAGYPQHVEASRLLGNASSNLHSARPGTVCACRALLAVEEAAALPCPSDEIKKLFQTCLRGARDNFVLVASLVVDHRDRQV